MVGPDTPTQSIKSKSQVMGEPRVVFTPISQDTVNLKSPVVEIKAREHKKELIEEEHDHYSGSVPSATDDAGSK